MIVENLLSLPAEIEFPQKEDLLIDEESQDFPDLHKTDPGFISELFRDLFFMPLHDVDLHGGKAPLVHQENIYKRFWFENNHHCVYYGKCEDIKKQFDVFNQKITFQDSDGSKIHVHFRVYETKSDENDDRPFTNLIVYGGNISTLDNNLGGNLAEGFCHVDKYLDEYRLRILNFSVYDITITPPDQKKEESFKPHCLADLGVVMARTLKALHQSYKSLDGIICHSLTCIVFSSALEYLKPEQLEILPKLIVLDRGTSSVKKATKSFTLGSLLHAFANFLGWSNKDELHICNYFLRCSKLHSLKDRDIWVISVEDDEYFKDPALDQGTLRYLNKLGMNVNGVFLKVPLDKSTAQANHARPRNEIGPLFGESVSDMILTKLMQDQKTLTDETK